MWKSYSVAWLHASWAYSLNPLRLDLDPLNIPTDSLYRRQDQDVDSVHCPASVDGTVQLLVLDDGTVIRY